ncbi:MAG: peptidylprolyl isomerase [Burkholderiales bacterium]|nr:peptidylprolyl isomerase [Burkholderiales bacterium]
MQLLKPSQILIIAASGIIAVTSCHAQQTSVLTKPVATVNGVAIPEARFDFVVKQNMTQRGEPDSPEMRKSIRETLINQEVVAQAAAKKGLDKSSDFQTMMDLSRGQNLVNAYLRDYVTAHPVTDAEMKQEFDKIKGHMGTKEYKVRHILVKTEAEAKKIIAQINKGAKFAKLAAEKSEDPGSKDKGGDLDWAPPSNFVKPFADAVAGLKKGEMTSEPVQTPFGWHVIQVEDERALKLPSYDQVKGQLEQRLQQEHISKLIADLRAGAKIEE